MLGLLQPTETRGKYQDVRLLVFTLQKLCIFSKNKKNYPEIICVKHLKQINIIGVNVVTLEFFHINKFCLDFTIFLFVVFFCGLL